MQLLEIVLQGVGRFPATLKANLKSGYNVLLGARQCGKTTVFEALLSILLGKKPGVELSSRGLAQGQPSRGGITIQEGNTVYRLMKEFRGGAVLLSRLNPSTSKFDPLVKGWEPIEAFLKKELTFPSLTVIESLYTMTPQSLPSVRPKSSPPPALSNPEPPPPVAAAQTLAQAGTFIGFDDEDTPVEETVETLETRLAQARADFSRVEEIDKLEFELGGIQSKAFELEKRISELDEADKAIHKVEEEMKQYKVFADLPEGIEARIASYRKVNEQKSRDVGQLEFEIDELQRHVRALGSEPFYKAKNFIVGIAVALGCLVASRVATLFVPWGNYVLLGSFIGFVLMIYVAWHDFGKQDLVKVLQDKIQAKKEKIAQVEKRFEIEGGVVRNLLRLTRLDAPEDLKLELENFRSLGIEEKLKDVQAKKQNLMKLGDRATYVKERDELKVKVKETEERLRGFGAAAKDANELRKEIKEIEKKLKKMKGSASTPSVQSPPAAPSAGGGVPVGGGPLGDIIRMGRAILLVDFHSFKASLKGKFMNYFSSITTQNYALDDCDESGGAFFYSSALGRRMAFHELPVSIQDIVYLSFLFSVLEIISERWKGPVLLDDPFINVEEGILIGIGQSLKKLGGMTQIVHFSSKGAFASLADHTVSLT